MTATETPRDLKLPWSSTVRGAFLLAFALAFIAMRYGIEFVRPTGIDSEKFIIYAKDFVFLFPATLLLLAALWHEPLHRLACQWEEFLGSGVPGWVKALASGLVCSAVAFFVYKTNAQIIDEAGYLFQARLFAEGQLVTHVPLGLPDGSLGDYVAIHSERAFGTYFPGQSLALMAGLPFHLAWLVNPILTALVGFITYRTGRRLYSAREAGTATALFLLSPFVIFQGASYFAQIAASCLFCGSLFLFIFNASVSRASDACSGLLAAALFLQRPYSAAILLLCLALNALWTSTFPAALRRGLVVGPVSALGIVALLAYNHAVTGNALLTPHDDYIRNIHQSEFHLGLNIPINTAINLAGLAVDLFGIPIIGLLPLGYLVTRFARLAPDTRFLITVCALYIFVYGLYSYHGFSYGPRYWFELVPIFCLLTAKALGELESSTLWKSHAGSRSVTAIFVTASTLVAVFGILPARFLLWSARGDLYTLPADLEVHVTAPAVVFMKREAWLRNDPEIAGLQHDGAIEKTPIFFLRDIGLTATELRSMFPDRSSYCLDLVAKTIASYPCANGR